MMKSKCLIKIYNSIEILHKATLSLKERERRGEKDKEKESCYLARARNRRERTRISWNFTWKQKEKKFEKYRNRIDNSHSHSIKLWKYRRLIRKTPINFECQSEWKQNTSLHYFSLGFISESRMSKQSTSHISFLSLSYTKQRTYVHDYTRLHIHNCVWSTKTTETPFVHTHNGAVCFLLLYPFIPSK